VTSACWECGSPDMRHPFPNEADRSRNCIYFKLQALARNRFSSSAVLLASRRNLAKQDVT
jgi:hypothetical protein